MTQILCGFKKDVNYSVSSYIFMLLSKQLNYIYRLQVVRERILGTVM